MKPNTRLLVRFTLENGMKSWGYDYPHYKTKQQFHDSIINDFVEWPENTEIHLFYDNNEEQITAGSSSELASVAINWLDGFGVFNGN